MLESGCCFSLANIWHVKKVWIACMLLASKLETEQQQIKTQVPFSLTVKTHKWKNTRHKAKHTWRRHITASSSTFLFLSIKKVSYFVKMKTKFKYYEYSLPSINKFNNVKAWTKIFLVWCCPYQVFWTHKTQVIPDYHLISNFSSHSHSLF